MSSVNKKRENRQILTLKTSHYFVSNKRLIDLTSLWPYKHQPRVSIHTDMYIYIYMRDDEAFDISPICNR